MANFNRYSKLIENGECKMMPGIKIPIKSTDKSIRWNKTTHRLDYLSDKYYQLPTEGWLIQMANPEHGTDEFDFPNGVLIRIPYPYQASLQSFIDELIKFDNKIGI